MANAPKGSARRKVYDKIMKNNPSAFHEKRFPPEVYLKEADTFAQVTDRLTYHGDSRFLPLDHLVKL